MAPGPGLEVCHPALQQFGDGEAPGMTVPASLDFGNQLSGDTLCVALATANLSLEVAVLPGCRVPTERDADLPGASPVLADAASHAARLTVFAERIMARLWLTR